MAEKMRARASRMLLRVTDSKMRLLELFEEKPAPNEKATSRACG
jgi:hypothetical protein